MEKEIRVKVSPGSKKEIYNQTGPQRFDVSVREPAQAGRANARVREIVASHFGVDIKKVRMVAGHRSSTKRFIVTI